MIIRGLLEETSGVLDHSQDGSGHSQVRAKYLKAASPSDSLRISWPALDRDQVDPAAQNSIWSCARTKWSCTSSPPLSSAVTPPTSLASQIFHPNSVYLSRTTSPHLSARGRSASPFVLIWVVV